MRYAVIAGYEAADCVNLVFHQCYQRRNHDGRALHDQGRQLVAQGLAASGRHEHEGVLFIGQMLDYPFLVCFERAEAKELFQFFMKHGRVDCHKAEKYYLD